MKEGSLYKFVRNIHKENFCLVGIPIAFRHLSEEGPSTSEENSFTWEELSEDKEECIVLYLGNISMDESVRITKNLNFSSVEQLDKYEKIANVSYSRVHLYCKFLWQSKIVYIPRGYLNDINSNFNHGFQILKIEEL